MILKVKCDKPTFKEVVFTEGLNIILADRTKESTKKDTRNGLGKSMLIEIIHFCLGGNASKDGLLAEPLEDWTFTVDLLIDNTKVSLSRNTKYKRKILIEADTTAWPIKPEFDSKTKKYEMTVRDVNLLLGQFLFSLPIEEQLEKYSPTFRGLISYFIRRGHDAYSTPFEHHRKQREFDKQIFNSYLLGLEWEYAREWQLLKDRKKTLEDLKKAAESGLLEGILGSRGELEAMRVRLAEKSLQQEKQLRSFQVHPQYKEIEAQATRLTREIHELENRNIADARLLDFYQQSVEGEKPPGHEELLKLYKEMGVVLPELVKNRFEEVETFHARLIENRAQFLDSEIKRLSQGIQGRNKETTEKGNERAKHMAILKTHKALDEYTGFQQFHLKTVEKLKDTERRIKNLKDFEEGKSRLAIEQEELLQRARQDLEERKEQTNRAIAYFNANSEALYEVPGNLIIDVQPNGFRFNVDIERSGSEGIGNMKVFCYDLMLSQLWSKRDPSPGFLIHDSIIFADVDERQRALALELAAKESRKHGFQYICTFNSDNVPWNEFSDDFKFNEYVRLTLTDAKEEGCLLGVRF